MKRASDAVETLLETLSDAATTVTQTTHEVVKNESSNVYEVAALVKMMVDGPEQVHSTNKNNNSRFGFH